MLVRFTGAPPLRPAFPLVREVSASAFCKASPGNSGGVPVRAVGRVGGRGCFGERVLAGRGAAGRGLAGGPWMFAGVIIHSQYLIVSCTF